MSSTIRVHAVISQMGLGGAETLLVDLAAATATVDIDLSVSFLNPREPNAAAERMSELGIEPVLVPFRRLVNVSDHRAIRRHLAAIRPDIVHTHLRSADLAGGLAARSLRLPQVSSLHGFDWDARDWEGARERAGNALVTMARKRFPRRVIAPCEAVERGYLAGTGDSTEHVVTINSGSARTARPGAGRGIRAELKLRPDEFVIAMVSRLHAVKRHDAGIEAVARVQDRVPGARLVIVGDGEEDGRLRSRAERLAPATIFTGYRRDVMELLDAADLLLHPSRIEGFPITLLEAMAARVPIVANRVGGIPDIVEHGITGILVAPPASPQDMATAIAAVHADANLRARLADGAARRFEERFTADRWAGRLRSFYETELELNGAGPGVSAETPKGHLPAPGA